MDLSSLIVAVVGAGGTAATLKVVVDIFTGRGKRKIERTASLTSATAEVLDIVKQQRDDFQAQADKANAELAKVRAELKEARDEIHDLHVQFERVIADEAGWASRMGYDDAPILRRVK